MVKNQNLSSASDGGYHDGMSPSQLLKHVKTLPARERKRLLREILLLEQESSEAKAPLEEAPVKWPDVEARGRRIVGNRVLPNLVLVERGEEDS
jgi:hypothetical protein